LSAGADPVKEAWSNLIKSAKIVASPFCEETIILVSLETMQKLTEIGCVKHKESK
jgi:hypothetical protein